MSVDKNIFLNVIRQIAPEYLAEEWDNGGLQVEAEKDRIERVLICLDITEEIIEEAIEQQADMIISHHPLIFKGLKQIRTYDWTGQMIRRLIKNDISAYTAHTSFDSVIGGNNDYFAELIGIQNTYPLIKNLYESFFKLAVFVPEDHFENVRKAICQAGAGNINNYRDCTFFLKGTGTFMPLENANPYIGSSQRLEYVNEYRLESIIPKSQLNHVISEMLAVHPYEEPAYDVYPLENNIGTSGLGRVGEFEEPMMMESICQLLKDKLGISEAVPYVQGKEKWIKRVALCTGSGADLIKKAYDQGCQLLITGDIKYHDAQYATQLGIGLIDAKHFYTEKIFVSNMAKKIKELLQDQVIVIESLKDREPFSYY